MDIAGFLRRYPPFDALTPERLTEVARSVEIEHFPAGAVILQQGGEPATRDVRRAQGRGGAASTTARCSTCCSRARCSVSSPCSPTTCPRLTVRAQEDTLCYLIPAATADPVLETRPG